jgi:tRNA-2-methylthio-N6-dimethylallyladenosine synthase
MKATKLLYIQTIGCQMNVYDSERMAANLAPLGYRLTDIIEHAGLIVLNTCAIRAKAEQKAYSFLGRLAEFKRRQPELIVAVGGCVAQQDGRRILSRMPWVDLVFGTAAVDRLADLIGKIQSQGLRIVDVDLTPGLSAESEDPPADLPVAAGTVGCFVTIMQGCDNFCTYCVVPHVRGRERSRPPQAILTEIRRLVDQGVREVTLLGQNVNSYGLKEGMASFTQLLERVNTIDGLLRIRFTTSHPKDLSPELIRAFGRIDKLCPHIHLPVQSGSNCILKKMNRKYTREQYLEKIRRLREDCPQIAITSDFIVGFPGETSEDLACTETLLHQVQYDGVFAFKYSDRTSAPAARLGDKIDESRKSARLQTLLDIQGRITRQRNHMLVGSVQPVLVEGFSKRQSAAGGTRPESGVQWTGRTGTNKIVNFIPEDDGDCRREVMAAGKIVPIRIDGASSHSLRGRPVCLRSDGADLKGGNCYAA